LKELFESEKLADVIIKTNAEKDIKAHSIILSRSDVFDVMLNKHNLREARTKTIEITDIDRDVLVETIRFLYYDEAPLIEEMALDLLVAADKYNIQALHNKCVNFLWQNVDMENFSQILVIADRLSIESLKDETIEFIIKNRKEIFPSETWKQLKKDNVQLAMEIIEKLSLTCT
jgi:speckle-type POZ protein